MVMEIKIVNLILLNYSFKYMVNMNNNNHFMYSFPLIFKCVIKFIIIHYYIMELKKLDQTPI